MVLAIDARRHAPGEWNVYTRGGRDDEGIDAVEWAARGEALGAGEILLTSMDTDGVQDGFDCALTRAVSRATHIPVIASRRGGQARAFRRACSPRAKPTPRSPLPSSTTARTRVDELKEDLDKPRHPGEATA